MIDNAVADDVDDLTLYLKAAAHRITDDDMTARR
jgi:hypothetical protein